MKVVIECLDGGEIVSDYCFKGWLGAKNAGHDVRLISLSRASAMQDLLRADRPMPIGSIMYMTWFMQYIYEIPVPEPLKAHKLNKGSYFLNWQEIDKKSNIPYPCFVKPLNDIKKFTGFVAKSEKDFELYPELNGWDGPYFTSEIIENIVSEWRFFVHNGKIVNASNYTGNPTTFFDFSSLSVVENVINNNKMPIAYTVDIALNDKRQSKLIELNDMWAIGPYGCNEDDYFAMLKDRWNEIIKPLNYDR